MLSIRPLPPHLAIKAAKELNENELTLASDLEALRNWLVLQPHLISRTDDQFLITFLRGCKYNMQRAKDKLDSYYSLRTALPQVFTNRDPNDESFLEHFKSGIVVPSPKPNKDGISIIFAKPAVYDPRKYNFLDALKWGYMIFDRYLTENDNFVICGHTLIVDMKGFSISHISQVTPTIIKNVSSLIQGAYPLRHKAIHIVNMPQAAEIIINLLKNLLPAKLAKTIFVHSDFNTLYQHFPKNVLPEEFGGTLGPLSALVDEYEKLYLTNSNWFIEDAQYKCDESKRLVFKKKNFFGVEGSFRKLEVD